MRQGKRDRSGLVIGASMHDMASEGNHIVDEIFFFMNEFCKTATKQSPDNSGAPYTASEEEPYSCALDAVIQTSSF